MFVRHALDTDCQRDGDNRRQAFRYRGYRNGNGATKHLCQAVIVNGNAQHHGAGRYQQDQHSQLPAKGLQLQLQWRGRNVNLAHQIADGTDFGIPAGGADNAPGGACGNH